MKNLKQIIFVALLLVGVSVTASAQKEGDKKPPPKEKPPVIVVEPKKDPKEDKPKEDKPKDGKKPQLIIFKGKYELSLI
jgi:hypothetical protein